MDKTTILIVEEEAIVAADLAGKLRQLGYEVAGIAASGEEAIEMACCKRPHIVLMDIWLKGPMDGIEAAEMIRSRVGVPVIHLTALSDAATLDRAKLSCSFGFIPIPFEERELATTIEMALLKYESDQQLHGQQQALRKAYEELEQRIEGRTRELEQANAYNRSLIEASLDPLVTIGHDGKITDVNAATEAATGRSRGELIGTDFCDYFSEPDKARAGYEQVFREGSVRDYPLELRHSDGRLMSVLYNASVFRNEEGEVIGVFAAARDVTELKRAEAALMALNDTLEDQVFERTAQLKSANETLRASRVAALNLMEDAVAAQKQAEEANEELRREIAEREQAEEALQESEERFRTLADNIPQLCWMANTDGWIFWYNKRWYQYTGTTPEQMQGWGWQSLHDQEVLPLVVEQWKDSLATGKPFDMVFPLRGADGQFRPFLTRIMPVFDRNGAVVRWFGTNTDITERKQAEESLRKSYQRLDILHETAGRLLASDSPQLVVNELCTKVMEFLDCHAFFNFLVDDDAGRLRLNACAGIPEDEMRRIEFLDYGTAVCGCAARDACRIVAEDIPGTSDPRTDLVKSYGIQAYACHPLMARGRVLGTLSFGTRSRPRFTNDELSLMKAVADQVAIAMERKRAEEELRRAKEAAETASKTKSQFLANMSHELRTPMTGVLGMLEHALETELDAQQRDFVGTAHKSARSLLHILNDILDLTRVEAGKMAIEERSFNPRDCLANAIDILVPETRRKGIDLNFSVAEDVPITVIGDQTRLLQVLTNLCGNAVKFTEKGKVEVKVTSAGRSLDGKRDITFTVSDTGIGIPDDKRHLLFKSFSQVDDSHTRRYSGTGLGLAISKEIVELMGGTITFESAEGRGTVFTFTIPFGEAGADTDAKRVAEPAPQVIGTAAETDEERKVRLLLAEDDPITRQVIGMMLKRSNFTHDIAENGIRAVELWEKERYDLILMDVQMPGMDGFAATGAIRERERERGGHTIIVAMTAHAFPEDERRCLEAGMDAYIPKPIDLKQCMAMIENLVKRGDSA